MKRIFTIMYFCCFFWVHQALAWHEEGHQLIASVSAVLTRNTIPAWFAAGEPLIRFCSADPDLFKNRSLPQLQATEPPEHFFDWEYLEGRPLPVLRSDFVKDCARRHLDPYAIGFLPYAVAEWTQKLAVAFAQCRAHPESREAQESALVFAGILAHYAADLNMPLHLTKFYDGKGADGAPAKTGIHAKIDGVFLKYTLLPADTAGSGKIGGCNDLWHYIISRMETNRTMVDQTLALKSQFSRDTAKGSDSAPLQTFKSERLRTSALFTATCFVSAWEQSAAIVLPEWHHQ